MPDVGQRGEQLLEPEHLGRRCVHGGPVEGADRVAAEVGVVRDHEHAVRAPAYVELAVVGADRRRVGDAGERVLGAADLAELGEAAPVGGDQNAMAGHERSR